MTGPLNRVPLGVVVVLALVLAAPASAPAKAKPITGKLSKRGYTVIALASDGTAEAVLAKHGKFKLRPPARRVTLHLRAPDATYAGPIVVRGLPRGKGEKKGKSSKRKAKKGKQGVIVGVRAGASLGKVKVKPGKGFALAKGVAEKSLNAKRTARAKKGVPIGAGNFGRVPVAKLKGPTDDLDLDGVPGTLDIDDDGDLILDNLDPTPPTPKTKSAHASIGPGEYVVGGFSTMFTDLFRTVNANAPGLSNAQIEAALPSFGYLTIGSISSPTGILQADPGTLPELDCGNPDTGLAYCRQNASTGRKIPLTMARGTLSGDSFPSCCDLDGDGFGTLDHLTVPPGDVHPTYANKLLHGATGAQVRSGDVLIERAMIGGTETEFPGALNFVFNTTPALVSYSDDAGNSGAPSYPGAAGAPGNQGNGFPVDDGPDPDSDVELTLTFWRPQRKPIAQEAGPWIDLGHLTYSVSTAFQGPGEERPAPGPGCPLSSYSESDPNLSPFTSRIGGPESNVDTWRSGLRDSANDQLANPANTLTFTLNLSECLAANSFTFNSGNEWGISLAGVPANTLPPPASPDQASTIVFFKRL